MRYRNYLLGLLLGILAFNYVDRMVLGLLLQDIKVDLELSDTQLGFLGGIAFALFYAVMGIPIARWADRGNRVTIVTLTTALWSAAVALCGLAGSFVQLLLVRIAVAVGEAGCFPPAYSLIADYFNRAERPRAVAFYMLGIPLSMVLGFFLAGWINELYGWRITFISLGLPGLLLAALARGSMKEPRFAIPNPDASDELPAQPSVKEVCATLWATRTFRHLLLGWSVLCFFGNGIWQWQPAFFIRSHGLNTGELGMWLALIWGGGGLVGTYFGGDLASRFATHREALQLRALVVVYCSFGILSAGIYLTPSYHVAFALMGVAAVGIAMANGPFFATIQSLIPERMRAMAIALIYLFANLIGLGLGPLVAGALSDALRPALGEDSLRYALLALSPGYFWGAWHLWRGSLTVTRDLEAVQGDCGSAPTGDGLANLVGQPSIAS